MISMRLNVHDLKRLKVMLMKPIRLIVQNVCTLPTGPHLADAGPNARPKRGPGADPTNNLGGRFQ